MSTSGAKVSAYVSARSARRRAVLDLIKLTAGCADCGYDEHAVALDFDHRPGTKRFKVSNKTRNSYRTLFAEIQNCDVVCSNCHRVRHWRKKGTK